MKKKKAIIIFIMLSMPCASVISQVSDLSLLSSLTEGIPGSIGDSETESEDLTENQRDSTKLNQEADFEDKNYGYTGGKNFTNPPQQKFSDKPLSYFGYDFFIGTPTTFAPTTNVPIP
ncbi:uncharacterized protein METZ01_LOCUS285624, partial [marine metagenome]